jgi:uncharacterized membrane-anchored protein
LNKVPAVTLAFWVINIAATTLGETGDYALSMTLNLGYAISTVIFFGILLVTLAGQVDVKSFHPFMYWAVIVSTTTVGTTLSDYLDRTLGLGLKHDEWKVLDVEEEEVNKPYSGLLEIVIKRI